MHFHPPVHAFEALTPDLVMDALASVGPHGDGRQLALSASAASRVFSRIRAAGEAAE